MQKDKTTKATCIWKVSTRETTNNDELIHIYIFSTINIMKLSDQKMPG